MDQRTNRKAFDRRVSLVLKKCVESLDRAKTGEKRPANWALLELIQMKKKEETKSGYNEILPPDSFGQKRKECFNWYGNGYFSTKRRECSDSSARDRVYPKPKEHFHLPPIETNVNFKRKGLVGYSAIDNPNTTPAERTNLFVSDISQNTRERPKKVNLYTSNISKWSNAIETMRTLRRYIKNEVTETNELLIGYMLSIDFPLLQAMYKFIRMTLPATSEISELDDLTKDKILIAMGAIDLWDKKQKKRNIPVFVNDLFAQINSIEGFIKRLLSKTSDDSNVDPVLLALMAHAFGLKIESEWQLEQTRSKYRSKTIRIS